MKKRKSQSYGDNGVARSEENFGLRSIDPEIFAKILKNIFSHVGGIIKDVKNNPAFSDKKTFLSIQRLYQYSLGGRVKNRNKQSITGFILEIEESLNKILENLDCYPFIEEIKKHAPHAWVKNVKGDYDLCEFARHFAPAKDYLDQIYKTGKLFQEDPFNRIIAITYLNYVFSAASHLWQLRLTFDSSNHHSIWIYPYEIGLLQGELSLIASFFDPEIADIHFRGGSSRGVSKRWVDLKKLKREAIKLADEQWKQEKNRDAFHTEMAKDVFYKIKRDYPDLVTKYKDQFTEKNVRKMLIPTAKKYDRVFGCKGVKKEKESIP
jgi:hypothetical protein